MIAWDQLCIPRRKFSPPPPPPPPPQVYPTTLRTKALGTANLIDRVGGIIGPYLGGYFVSEVRTTSSRYHYSIWDRALCI
jgi:hypothetical protein